MPRPRATLLVILLLLSLPGRTQEAPDGTTDSSTPLPTDLVERVEVRLRQINFLALDRRGNPVADLKPEEIEVRQSGEPQEIAFLDRYRREPLLAGTSAGAQPARPESSGEAPATPSAGSQNPEEEISAPPPARTRGRWLVLFFDNYLSDPLTRQLALESSREFLAQRVEPNDLVQVVVFDGKLEVIQPFTNNPILLESAIHAVASRMDRVVGDRFSDLDDLMDALEGCRNSASAPSCAGGRASAYENDRWRESDALLTALIHVVRSVKAVPDVKALVMFSNGFAREPSAEARDAVRMILGENIARYVVLRDSRRMDELYDVLAGEAAESKVSFFPINPGGRRMTTISADRKGWYDERAIDTSVGDIYRRGDQNFQAALEELSRRTGGRATRSSEVLESLNKAFDLTAGLYSVGYRPEPGPRGAGTGKVKIKILRRGVRAVVPDEVPPPAVRPPLEGELTLEGGACENGRRPVTFQLRLDLSSLEFERVEEELSNNFTLYLRFSDGETGALLDRDFRYLNVSYPRKGFDLQALPDPTLEQQVLVPCRPLVVEIVACDANSGARRIFSKRLPV
jgi:VWFA-related protein